VITEVWPERVIAIFRLRGNAPLGEIMLSIVRAKPNRMVSVLPGSHGAHLVVIGHPPLRRLPDFSQALQEIHAQHLTTIGAVESFNVSVLVRLSRLYVADHQLFSNVGRKENERWRL
jgi:hypothetical protein